MQTLFVLGVDLAGPANADSTAAALFRGAGKPGGEAPRRLTLVRIAAGWDDDALAGLADGLKPGERLVAGLDAPLSYNAGGGDRPADRRLRERLVAAGLPPGSVMAPTAARMVYLTLRGALLARALAALPRVGVVETHPTGVLALRGAPVGLVREMKRRPAARRRLLGWLDNQGLGGAASVEAATDHHVAACAAALAAWKWWAGEPVWLEPAAPPRSPFDFAC